MDDKAQIEHLRHLNDKYLNDLVKLEEKYCRLWADRMALSYLLNKVTKTGAHANNKHRLVYELTLLRMHLEQSVWLGSKGFLGIVYDKDTANKTYPVIRKTYLSPESLVADLEGAPEKTLISMQLKVSEPAESIWLIGDSDVITPDGADVVKACELFRKIGYELILRWDPEIETNRMHFKLVDKTEDSNGT